MGVGGWGEGGAVEEGRGVRSLNWVAPYQLTYEQVH